MKVFEPMKAFDPMKVFDPMKAFDPMKVFDPMKAFDPKKVFDPMKVFKFFAMSYVCCDANFEQFRGVKVPLGDYRCTCFQLGLCSKVLLGH